MSNLPRHQITSRRLERAAVAVITVVAAVVVALSGASLIVETMTKAAIAIGDAITTPTQAK